MTGVRHPLATISDELKTRMHFTKRIAPTVHPAQSSEQQATYINLIGPYTPNFLVAIGMLSQSLYYQVSFLITFSSFLPDECAVCLATQS